MKAILSGRLIVAAVALLGSGCRRSIHPPIAAAPDSRMPSLEAIPLRFPMDSLVDEPRYVALTTDGHLTFFRDATQSPLLVVVDSTGSVSARWGRLGPGPGEFNGDELLLSGDSLILAAGLSDRRLETFNPAGQLRGDVVMPSEGLPSAVISDSVDIWQASNYSAPSGPVLSGHEVIAPFVRRCLAHDCSRVLLAASDSILRTIVAVAPRLGEGPWPPFAAEPGRFVAANGYSYRLWMYSDAGHLLYSFGRNVAPRMVTPSEFAEAEAADGKVVEHGIPGPDGKLHRVNADAKVQALREQPRAHFQYNNLAFDEHHRLWVIGKANDSTFLDVFADSTFLGRIMVDCRRFSASGAVRGHWLALGCESPDSLAPYAVRLFRIRENPLP
jgi:hypothetical protein